MNKICLIGYGYWGKIIHRNLKSMGMNNVSVFDEILGNMGEIDDSYDLYFVVTPFGTHKSVLDKILSYKNKKVWCEKPLVDNVKDALYLYNKARENGNILFVDWIYTFNKGIERIKNIISSKKIKFILLNRTNDGPARNDCTSVEDLSVHDLSILYYLFGSDEVLDFQWNEFSIKNHEKFGSNISHCYFDGTQIIINSSWQHKHKNRVSIFVTDDDEMITFDDKNKLVLTKDEVFLDESSPLQNAIDFFIKNQSFPDNMEITFRITENIERYKGK